MRELLISRSAQLRLFISETTIALICLSYLLYKKNRTITMRKLNHFTILCCCCCDYFIIDTPVRYIPNQT